MTIDDDSVSSRDEDDKAPVFDADSISGHEDKASATGSNHGTGSSGNSHEDAVPSIAQREGALVNYSKFLVLFVLIVVATVLSTTTYLFTRDEESDNFEQEFESHSRELTRNARTKAENMFGQLDSLSNTISAYYTMSPHQYTTTEGKSESWPFVTYPFYYKQAEDAAKLANLELVMFAPLVSFDEKEDWEAYANTALSNREEVDLNTTMKIEDFDATVTLKAADHAHQRHLEQEDIASDKNLYGDESSLQSQFDSYHAPVWQYSTSSSVTSLSMKDLNSIEVMKKLLRHSYINNRSIMSMNVDADFFTEAVLGRHYLDKDNKLNEAQLIDVDHGPADHTHTIDPNGLIIRPIHAVLDDKTSDIVGFLIGVFAWHSMFTDVLPEESKSLYVVVKDTCGSDFDYFVSGTSNTFVQVHDTGIEDIYSGMKHEEYLTEAQSQYHNEVLCRYKLSVYPTPDFESTHIDTKPILYTCTVFLIFIFAIGVFILYDRAVYLRQKKVMNAAIRSNAVVSSLFPKQFRTRLINDTGVVNLNKLSNPNSRPNKKSYFKNNYNNDDDEDNNDSAPIADLFPEASVLFADVVGFTAWSSTREPSQVFTLLETVYSEFDAIAKQRRVFKIETVGDCYVAVAGVPEPCRNHALMMCRFANDCLSKMAVLVKRLEVELGPDTGDLGLRVGIHSGPVTAGVLRGERARFQLFGDTVNTAARMESTGARNQIQVSQETAELLITSGKSHWLKARQAPVYAKGKGELQTYWLQAKTQDSNTEKSTANNALDAPQQALAAQDEKAKKDSDFVEKQRRLIDWNSDMLQRYLNDIVKRREVTEVKKDSEATILSIEEKIVQSSGIVLDEASEIINLPKYTAEAIVKIYNNKNSTAGVTKAVSDQLKGYVATIAELYRDNAFHNFEHASHVTMSVVKLLSRIVAPDLKNLENGSIENDMSKCLHDYTYGITSDPLTQFSVILSALIHDVDHTGVPNNQLVKEQCSIALVYQNKSVAEQNSIDIAWNLLMEKEYKDLRRAIYSNKKELVRFRQLLVNTVLATDIMDKDLGAQRKARWSKAFAEAGPIDGANSALDQDRKATIVIEHLIQASDVAHTMQHWHIYRKWNKRLFEEMYNAFKEGRAEKNPAEFWYQGEMGFFDHYIIPLAMKLRSCGVFGVSSDEYLNYARQNRAEWERKGKQVVAELVETLS